MTHPAWHPFLYPPKPYVYIPSKLFQEYPSLWRDRDLMAVLYSCFHCYVLSAKTVSIDIGKTTRDVHLERGQFIFGREAWAAALGMSPSSVRNKMSRLGTIHSSPDTHQILDIKPDTHGSIVTICDYWLKEDKISEVGQQLGQQMDSSRTAGGQTLDTKNTFDTDIPKNKTPRSPRLAEFVLPDWIPPENWDAWLKMRRKIKKPATEEAQALAVTALEKLRASGQDPGAVLDQSVLNSWQGLFEVKENGNGKSRGDAGTGGRPKLAGEPDKYADLYRRDPPM